MCLSNMGHNYLMLNIEIKIKFSNLMLIQTHKKKS